MARPLLGRPGGLLRLRALALGCFGLLSLAASAAFMALCYPWLSLLACCPCRLVGSPIALANHSPVDGCISQWHSCCFILHPRCHGSPFVLPVLVVPAVPAVPAVLPPCRSSQVFAMCPAVPAVPAVLPPSMSSQVGAMCPVVPAVPAVLTHSRSSHAHRTCHPPPTSSVSLDGAYLGTHGR